MSERWLLRETDDPAAVLAATLVSSLGLSPPIDVESLVLDTAAIVDKSWSLSSDAISVGLFDSQGPTVFLRNDLPWRRRRFTLAHELGHIEMYWHIGEVACSPGRESKPDEAMGAVSIPSDIWSVRRRVEEQESEATRFASHLLMPESLLRPLVVSGAGMGGILDQLGMCSVSASAILMRLREVLMPGFFFAMQDYEDNWMTFRSSGTSLPVEWDYGTADTRALELAAKDHGSLTVSGRRVKWFRLSEFDGFLAARRPHNYSDTA